MSFDKNYPNRKDKRRPYYDGRAVDPWLRSHGRSSWRRLHNSRKRLLIAKEKEKE